MSSPVVDIEMFRARFPEFEKIDDCHIQAHLDGSRRIIGPNCWKEVGLRTEVVLYRTADSLATSPYGHRARLSVPGQPSAYAHVLEELMKANPARVIVVADGFCP